MQKDRKQIAKAIRIRSVIVKDRCFVCGDTHRLENHHIIKVQKLADFLVSKKWNQKVAIYEIPIPCAPLCKPHHHIAHILYGDIEESTSVTPDEADKYREMMDIADAQSIIDDISWADDFNDIIYETINTVEENLERYEVV